LTVGSGASTLNANHYLILKSSPDAPFINGGTFTVRGNGFTYSTGTLAGTGTFLFSSDAVLNLTDSASKTISTNVVVEGKASCQTDKTTDLVLKNGNFMISPSATFTTVRALTVMTDSSSTFSVKGSFSFAGPALNFQGNGFNLASWSLNSGTATINNGISSDNLMIASGATLLLIGAPTDKKNFNTVTGAGVVNIQGGTVTFASLTANVVTATGGNVTITNGNFGALTLAGSFLAGSAIKSTTVTLNNGFVLGGLKITATTLSLGGVVSVSDDGTSLIVTNNLNIPSVSQLTFNAGSSLMINKGAEVKQQAGFTVVQGPPTPKSPMVVNDGSFISSNSLFMSGVPVSGSGSFSLGVDATWTLNNVVFNQASFASSGKVTFSIGTFDVPMVTGTGSFSGNPNSFVSTILNAASFNQQGGVINVNNATITTLTLNNGATFQVATGATFTTLEVLGGTLVGKSGQVPISCKQVKIVGSNVQKLQNLALKSSALALTCGTSCQLLTTNVAFDSQ